MEPQTQSSQTSLSTGVDIAAVGRRVKQIYPTGVSKDGRSYASIPDEEIGSKYLLANGDKALPALGMSPNTNKNYSKVVSEGGSDLISKGKTQEERAAIADQIVAAGGINAYRKSLPLKDLVNDKEAAALDTSTNLLTQIDRASEAMKDRGPLGIGGTGPLAQFIPGFLRTQGSQDKVADAEQVRATYQQMVSGKVISDQEAKRLSAFLPTKGKTEAQNERDLERLRQGIDLNLQLFEKAKREGLTPNEAYAKYGKDIMKSQTGQDNKGSTAPSNTPQNQVSNESIPSRLVGGAMNNVNSLVRQANMVDPKQWVTNPEARGDIVQTVTHPVENLKAAGSDLLNTFGGEVKNGEVSFSPQRALNHAIDNPVNTAMMAYGAVEGGLGALGKRGALPEIGVSKVPEAVSGVANATGEAIKTGSTKAADLVTGGGTKEQIARSVMQDNPVSMNETLQSKGILSKPTIKGKIEATQKAIVDENTAVKRELRNSNKTYSSRELADQAKDYLKQRYGEGQATVIDDVVNQMAKEGVWDPKTGEQTLNPLQLDKAKTGLYDYGLRQLGLGESGKIYAQMGKDLSSFLRGKIAADVPSSTPYLRNEANLITYRDDILTDPTGLKPKGTILSTLGSQGQNIGGMVTQGAYNLGNKLSPNLPPITQPNFAPAPQVIPVAENATPFTSTLPAIAPEDVTSSQPRILKRDMRYKKGNFQSKK